MCNSTASLIYNLISPHPRIRIKMDANQFITVGKKTSAKEKESIVTKVTCNWCKAPGHIKSACEKLQEKNRRDEEIQKRKEERIANLTCNWCKEKGHGWDFCEKRKDSFKKKEETQRKMDRDFPPIIVASSSQQSKPIVGKGWANVAKQNRDEKMIEKINKTEEELAKKRKQEKEKAHKDYLERMRIRDERQKTRENEYIADMETRFGTKWFNWVDTIEDGKYDSNIAGQLRCEYEEEQYRRECEYDDMERKIEKKSYEQQKRAEEEDQAMKNTLSPQSYLEWRAQKDEDEMDENEDWLFHGSMEWQRSEIDYLSRAPSLYREHYRKTCQQLNWHEKILENRELSWPTKKHD